MNEVAIVGISSISSAGKTIEEIKEKLMRGVSNIGKISYFDSSMFTSHLAGNILEETWKEVKAISTKSEIDISSALSIYSIERLLKEVEPLTSHITLSVGTCNGGIDSLSKFYISKNKLELINYPVYKQLQDISDYFDFTGGRYLFNNACSASGMALSYGAELIDNGKAQVVIAGGSDPLSKMVFAGFNSLKALNSAICEPYGENFGLNLGEAATYFMLESVERAKLFKHKIYGTVLGYGLSNDAYHPTAPDIEGNGIASAINNALKDSRISATDVTYVNSHGTGTKANDISEFAGIKKVFENIHLPYISSMKGYIGHNLGAAASTELALSLIALQDGIIFPNHNFTDYREGCNDERIIREPKNVSGDVIIVNDNAAFGGHNVATVLKVNTEERYEIENNQSQIPIKPVYINLLSFVTDKYFISSQKKGE